jgi:hypothetical protein
VSGDVQAAALFLSYAVGKPLPAVNPDRLDLDEFAIVDSAPTLARTAAVMLSAMDPSLVVALVRSIIPADQDATIDAIKKLNTSTARTLLAEQDARVGKPAG